AGGVFIGNSAERNTVKESTIAFNKGAGVVESASSEGQNIVDPNLIFDNDGLGIQLDPEDKLIDVTPELTAAVFTAGNLTITGTLHNLPSTHYLLEFFEDD